MALVGTGCADKESIDPGTLLREEIASASSGDTVNRIGPPSRATSRTVRCECDEEGDLHVRAPEGSRVFRPDDGDAAAAEVVLPDDPAPAPFRRTKSLGFIGDGKLGASRVHGGPWAVPDALLPPHSHGAPTGYGYGYRARGYHFTAGALGPRPRSWR